MLCPLKSPGDCNNMDMVMRTVVAGCLRARNHIFMRDPVRMAVSFGQLVLLGICLLSLSGCASINQNLQHERRTESETEAVRSVFYHSGAKDFEAWNNGEEVVFISNGWATNGWTEAEWAFLTPRPHNFAPAPQEWINRLSIPGVDIKSANECIGQDGDAFVIDKTTGRKGIIFQVETTKWISPEEVHMRIWWYSGFMSATIEEWILTLRDGQWSARRISVLLQ